MSTPSVRPFARARAFTLLEVMAAVMIVTILAAIALPGFVQRVRERRANQKAQDFALFYKTARARALGRGAAQMVRFDTSNIPQGELILYESVLSQASTDPAVTGCGQMPVQSCLTTNWIPGQPNVRQVANLNLGGEIFNTIFATFSMPGAATTPVQADICFTPLGRAFIRAGGSSPWVDMTALALDASAGAPFITVQRYDTSAKVNPIGIVRTVVIPPNGEARLFL